MNEHDSRRARLNARVTVKCFKKTVPPFSAEAAICMTTICVSFGKGHFWSFWKGFFFPPFSHLLILPRGIWWFRTQCQKSQHSSLFLQVWQNLWVGWTGITSVTTPSAGAGDQLHYFWESNIQPGTDTCSFSAAVETCQEDAVQPNWWAIHLNGANRSAHVVSCVVWSWTETSICVTAFFFSDVFII